MQTGRRRRLTDRSIGRSDASVRPSIRRAIDSPLQFALVAGATVVFTLAFGAIVLAALTFVSEIDHTQWQTLLPVRLIVVARLTTSSQSLASDYSKERHKDPKVNASSGSLNKRSRAPISAATGAPVYLAPSIYLLLGDLSGLAADD